ncbi:MAG: hypothetical protein AAB552_03970 [Patescibacteria group bacterium]
MKITNIILLTLAIVGVIVGATYWSQDWSAGWGFLGGAVVAPSAPAQNAPAVPQEGVTIKLKIGEVKQLKDFSVKIASIDSDSRCPQGVTCVWAGQVALTLEVTIPPSSANAISLKTDGVSNSAGAYTFLLLEVSPAAVFGKEIAKEEYSATIIVKPFHVGDIKNRRE